MVRRHWKSFDFDAQAEWTFLQAGGVYAFYADGRLLYVGQTANISKRISTYKIRYKPAAPGDTPYQILTPWGTFVKVFVKVKYPRKFGAWAMIEQRLIRRLQPPFNCVGSIRARGLVRA